MPNDQQAYHVDMARRAQRQADRIRNGEASGASTDSLGQLSALAAMSQAAAKGEQRPDALRAIARAARAA